MYLRVNRPYLHPRSASCMLLLSQHITGERSKLMHVKEPSIVMIHGRKMAFDEVCPPNPKGTILLLTGLAAKRLGWYRQLGGFGRYYRTIALDHRGTGDSDDVTEAYTISDLADDATAVLQARGIQRAH